MQRLTRVFKLGRVASPIIAGAAGVAALGYLGLPLWAVTALAIFIFSGLFSLSVYMGRKSSMRIEIPGGNIEIRPSGNIPRGNIEIIRPSRNIPPGNIEIIRPSGNIEIKGTLTREQIDELAHALSEHKPPKGVRAVQKVMFATTRQINESQDDVELDVEKIVHHWRTNLRYGRTWISIPEAHKLGVVERPELDWRYAWLRRQPEDISRHFTVLEVWKLSKNTFCTELRVTNRSSALVFVHGYNVSFTEAIFSSRTDRV
jgi:hypothetical protein